ncbi:MAG: hypothetical protein Q7S74_05100 [Nanoarchaeota archaeon]|nr:hypothetical protein [Nanoarchaeota archaeon]
MFWSKKESVKNLPDFPPIRTPLSTLVPRPPVEMWDQGEFHSLPSFPDSPKHNQFSQAVIKDAVNAREESQEGNEFPDDNMKSKSFKVMEMGGWNSTPELGGNSSMMSNEAEYLPVQSVSKGSVRVQEETSKFSRPPQSRGSEIFVKIDKFHSAKRALGDIKSKVEEIDEIIKKIRETKLREEQELAAWEKDILHVKTRLKDVTENIFERVD